MEIFFSIEKFYPKIIKKVFNGCIAKPFFCCSSLIHEADVYQNEEINVIHPLMEKTKRY